MTAAISYIASKISPDFRTATDAVLCGATDNATLHAARLEIARFTDRMIGRGRRPGRMTPARKRTIDTGLKAYDEIAAEMDKRGEL